MTYPVSTTADTTVSSAAALTALLDSWEANWAGTVPSGKSSSDERMIGVDTSVSTTVDLQNYTFPQRVWIRGVGTFTDKGCSVEHTGQWVLDGSTNLRLYLMSFRKGEAVHMDNSTGCGVVRCMFKGMVWPTDPTTTPLNGKGYGLDIGEAAGNTTTDFDVINCSFAFYETGIYIHQGNISGLTMRGNIIDWIAHDSLKCSAASTGFTFENNWGARNISATVTPPSTGFHEDFFQKQGGSWTNATLKGNVVLRDNARWHVDSAGSYQGFFSDGGITLTNVLVTQNVMAVDNTAVKLNNATLSGTTATYNGMLWAGVSDNYAGSDIAGDYNFVEVKSGTGGAGANGIAIDIGTNFTSPDRSVMDTYFEYGAPVQGDPIGQWLPKSGKATHWSFGGVKVGPYSRLQELFVTGGNKVPGNVGWPVAYMWEQSFNYVSTRSAPKLTTTYTGVYDANGDNVGGSPPDPDPTPTPGKLMITAGSGTITATVG